MNDETRDTGSSGVEEAGADESAAEAQAAEQRDPEDRAMDQIQVLPLVALRDTVIFP